jgi:hypothetical protein
MNTSVIHNTKMSHQCYYLLKKGHAFNIILLILSRIHEVPSHTGTLVLIRPYGLLTAYQCILNAKNYFPCAYEQKEIVIKVATTNTEFSMNYSYHELKYALVRPSKTKSKSWNIQHKNSTLEPEQAPVEQSLVCNLNALATSGLQ